MSPIQDVITQEFETDSFAHFDDHLLQVNVLFEVGMCSSSPEQIISEWKTRILLVHNTDNIRDAIKTKVSHSNINLIWPELVSKQTGDIVKKKKKMNSNLLGLL